MLHFTKIEATVCRLSPPLEGTSYEPTSRNVFSPGDTVRVNCGNKHWISNLWNTSAEATCKENGDWTLRPVCQGIEPQRPTDYEIVVLNCVRLVY